MNTILKALLIAYLGKEPKEFAIDQIIKYLVKLLNKSNKAGINAYFVKLRNVVDGTADENTINNVKGSLDKIIEATE